MMTRDELIEAMARAVCGAEVDDWNREQPGGDLLPAYGPLATAALAAIEAAGCVVAPREPTREMVEAGRCRPYCEDDSDAENMDMNTELTWCAMLAASPLAQEPSR